MPHNWVVQDMPRARPKPVGRKERPPGSSQAPRSGSSTRSSADAGMSLSIPKPDGLHGLQAALDVATSVASCVVAAVSAAAQLARSNSACLRLWRWYPAFRVMNLVGAATVLRPRSLLPCAGCTN